MVDPSNDSSVESRVVSKVVIAIGILCALEIGSLIGDDSVLLVLAGFAATVVIVAVLVLQERIWILIPTFWCVTGKIDALRSVDDSDYRTDLFRGRQFRC